MIDLIRAPAITQLRVEVDIKWGNGDIVTDHNTLYAQIHELLGGWWPEGATWYSGSPVHIRIAGARAGHDTTSLFTRTPVPRVPTLRVTTPPWGVVIPGQSQFYSDMLVYDVTSRKSTDPGTPSGGGFLSYCCPGCC